MASMTINDVYQIMDTFYPFSTQMSFDNAGFLVGDGKKKVNRIMVALDITSRVIDEASSKRCELIITHHPVIFNPLKTLVAENPTENMLMSLVKQEIGVISAHTNLDRSIEGVNFHLAKQLELEEGGFLVQEGVDPQGSPYGLGWVGRVPDTISLDKFTKFVATQLGCQGMRVEDAGKKVRRVAVGGGACGNLLAEVAKFGCDTFVTGDVKYDVFLEARERRINLIDAGHFPTEQVICMPLAKKLQEYFKVQDSPIKVYRSSHHEEISFGQSI